MFRALAQRLVCGVPRFSGSQTARPFTAMGTLRASASPDEGSGAENKTEQQSQQQQQHQQRHAGGGSGQGRRGFFSDNAQLGWTIGTVAVVGLAASYAAVPLYQLFCRTTGYFGAVKRGDPEAASAAASRADVPRRPVTVRFLSDVAGTLDWQFVPVQKDIKILPGETALGVYQATNKTDQAIIGVATYNVAPASVAPYFVKVQCFCFEHQRLGPHETVDMPVLFYLDPEIANDPVLHDLSTVTLSYTFFKADRQGEEAVAAAAAEREQQSQAAEMRRAAHRRSQQQQLLDAGSEQRKQLSDAVPQ